MRNQVFAVLAVVLVFAAIGCASRQQIAATSDLLPVPIKRQTQINEPGLKQMGVLLINSQEELERLTPEADSLVEVKVDFSRESLVVLCLGERPTGGYWARITGVQRDPQSDALYVQGVANQPGADDVVIETLTYPCDAAVVPKVPARVIHPEIDSSTGAAMTTVGAPG